MNLFQAILSTGILLTLLGVAFMWAPRGFVDACRAFPRHKVAGYVLFGLAAAWFLLNVSQLSKADEIGFLSNEVLLYLFIAVAFLTVPLVPDFLAVRGLAILVLLASRMLLDVSWMQYSTSQRLLNAAVYVAVVAALIVGASPYKLRDFFDWAFAPALRGRIVGALVGTYGVVLVASAFAL